MTTVAISKENLQSQPPQRTILAKPDEYNWNILLSEYYRIENMDNLKTAISRAELAVSNTGEDDPDRAE